MASQFRGGSSKIRPTPALALPYLKLPPAASPIRPPPATPMRRRGWFQPLLRTVRREPLLLAFVPGAVIARIAFWAISNRMFEDGLTTITHARNVPLGLGLVNHPGEGHVHGFTSALGVLIPLAGELIHEGSGMFAIRVASLGAVCVALVYARLISRDLGLGAFPTAFVLAYIAFDQNMIFYGMAGMETQVAVAVILGGVYHVRRQDPVASGIWLGLAPLARPEFVLWVAPALAYLAFRNLRPAVRSAGIAAGIVAPWLVFTSAYYGSPIPNTIVAKSTVYPIPPLLNNGSPGPWLDWLAQQVIGHVALFLNHIEPFREVWNTADTPIPALVLIGIAVLVADFFVVGLLASRLVDGFWPVTVFLGLFLAYWTYFIPLNLYYDWYMPPFLVLVMLVVAIGLDRLGRAALSARPDRTATVRAATSRAVGVVLAVAFAIHMPWSFVLESKVQSIENQVRTQMALYLKSHVPPGQSVVSESAGYVSFYGDVKLYDYPGLTSTTSVRALKLLPPGRRDIADFIALLQPDWLVLRPWELDSFQQQFPAIAAEYEVDRVFELPGVPESDLSRPGGMTVSYGGLAEVDVDGKFIVLKRTSPPARQ